MTKILDVGWEEMRDPTAGLGGNPLFSPPTTAGGGSIGAIRTGNTLLAEEPGAAGPTIGPGGLVDNTLTLLHGNPARSYPMSTIVTRDFLTLSDVLNPYHQYWFGNGVNTNPNLTQWSVRIMCNMPGPIGSVPTHMFSGLKHVGAGSTPTDTAWWLECKWHTFDSQKYFQLLGYTGAGVNAYNGAGSQGVTQGWGRLEIQADSTVVGGPNIVFRFYQNDKVNPAYLGPLYGTVTGGADICGFNLGDKFNIPGGSGTTDYKIGEVEAWDTRNADGEMSNTWSTAAGGAFTSNPSPVGQRTTVWKFPTATHHRHLDAPILPPHTYHSSVPYGNHGRVFDMWIPGGTPAPANPNGFPCIVWVHGGFWTSGSRGQVPQAWLAAMLGAGYVVCSVEYVLGSICGTPLNSTTTYPAYGSNGIGTDNQGGGARFPSDICDVKLAVVRLKAKYAHGIPGTAKTNGSGWGIDPTLVGMAGFSAGSNTAAMVAFTRGLSDIDGSGKDVRMATADGGAYNTDETGAHNLSPDPEFIFYLGYAVPWDVTFAVDNDWGKKPPGGWKFGIILTGGGQAGTYIEGTVRARYATWINGTLPSVAQQTVLGCSNAITRNLSAVTDLHCRVVWGSTDFLIGHAQHKTHADSFMPPKVADWESELVPSIHDWTQHIGLIGYPNDIAFLNAAVEANSGEPPDPPDPAPMGGGLNIPQLTTVATIATPIGATGQTGVTPVAPNTWENGNWNDGNWS